MNLSRIWNWKYLLFGKELPARRKERIISSYVRTHAFAKLTIQDKILSLGKLITIFRADCGFTPAGLERTLKLLKADLDRQTNDTWHALYSEPYFKPGDKRREKKLPVAARRMPVVQGSDK